MSRSQDVPPDLRLLESFANSVDVTSEQDDLIDADRFAQWLAEHERPLAGDGRVSETDLGHARRLRDRLRAIMASHHQGSDHPIEVDNAAELIEPMRARISFAPDGTAFLEPDGEGVRQFLAEIATGVALASTDGRWGRMKVCFADDCAVAYYDTSKNHSKRWCSMQACGNKQKTRAYYERHSAKARS